MNTERPTCSRHEFEQTDTDCPQGCADTAPCWRGMRRVTHYTGEYRVIEVPYDDTAVVERTDEYLECPTCGWVIDV